MMSRISVLAYSEYPGMPDVIYFIYVFTSYERTTTFYPSQNARMHVYAQTSGLYAAPASQRCYDGY